MIKKILVLMVVGFVNWQFTTFTLADDGPVSIKGVISNPVHYDGKKVTVEGEIEKVHYTTSSSGNPYTLFRLYDSEHNSIGVYSKGRLLISKGTKVRVTGEFKKEKRAVIFKFKNVIKAKQVEEIG